MNYQIIIPESVYAELNEAAIYYESKEDNLGVKFVMHWEMAMEQLKKSPLLYQKKYKHLRSIYINRFPYLLVYEIVDNKVFIYRLIQAQKNPKKIFKK